MNLFHTPPLDGVTPPPLCFSQTSLTVHHTYLYSRGGGRGIVRVNWFSQEHSTITWLGLEPVLLV